MANQITQEQVAPYLPDGAVITHVKDKNGKPVINIKTPEWQTAVEVGETDGATREAVIRAAWMQETQLQWELVMHEVRDAYNAQLAELQDWLRTIRQDAIDGALGALKNASG